MKITGSSVYGDSKSVADTPKMINTSILVVVTAIPTRRFYPLMSTYTGYTECVFPTHLTPEALGFYIFAIATVVKDSLWALAFLLP